MDPWSVHGQVGNAGLNDAAAMSISSDVFLHRVNGCPEASGFLGPTAIHILPPRFMHLGTEIFTRGVLVFFHRFGKAFFFCCGHIVLSD